MSNAKGFQSFVNSLITDKGTLLKKAKGGVVGAQQEAAKTSHEEDVSDLALIQQMQALTGTSDSKKGKAMNDRARGVGLGYDKNISEAEIQANEQIHKLKKQLQREQKQKDDDLKQEQDLLKFQLTGAAGTDGKSAQIQKKTGQGDERQAQLENKRQKKREKKERQKARKEQEAVKEKEKEQTKVAVQEKVKLDPKYRDHKVYQKRQDRPPVKAAGEDGPIPYTPGEDRSGEFRPRMKTKTRSKQKNKRKDNRPIEVKRVKLAERGIVI